MGARYWKSEGGALTARGTWRGTDVVLAKPQSFMNASGGPVKQVLAKHGAAPDHLIVVHDEIDLPEGVVRVKFGGGHDGHNGLRSICDKLRTHDFGRVRCGVGRPPGRMAVADYVLCEPRRKAAETFQGTLEDARRAVLAIVEAGFDAASKRVNG